MRCIGFVGGSGTGKSHRALIVAKERNIDYIIDDGLLIQGNRVVAGISAKREKTRIGSIKRALFLDREHVEMVVKAVGTHKPEGILIIGTSDGMVEKIAKNLSFPPIQQKVYINEVANEEEIEKARSIRAQQGKHVIPVPTFEIKKEFSGYFLDPLQIFRGKGKSNKLFAEKSVVRPSFSYLGSYTISDYTIYQIIEKIALDNGGISKITRFRAENRPEGIFIDMDVIIKYGYSIRSLIDKARTEVVREVEKLTAINIKILNITVKSLVLP